MKRYATISQFSDNKLVDYYYSEKFNNPFIVDDSVFVPMAEAVKQLSKTSEITEQQIRENYDFPDGKDTGMEIPITRQHGIADITEISSAIMEKTEKLVEAEQKAKKRAKAQSDFEAKVNAINNVQVSSSEPTPSNGSAS